MNILAINDIHLGSPIALCSYDELLIEITKSKLKPFLLGDIIDMRNCKKKDIPMWLNRGRYLQELCNQLGGAYISGNHELNLFNLVNSFSLGNTLLAHGDEQSWGLVKSHEFRSQQAGAGFLKRHLLTPLLDELRHLNEVRPNDKLIQFMSNMKEQMLVIGHSHPNDDVKFQILGKKGLILSRGFHIVDIV